VFLKTAAMPRLCTLQTLVSSGLCEDWLRKEQSWIPQSWLGLGQPSIIHISEEGPKPPTVSKEAKYQCHVPFEAWEDGKYSAGSQGSKLFSLPSLQCQSCTISKDPATSKGLRSPSFTGSPWPIISNITVDWTAGHLKFWCGLSLHQTAD
jgi:hypothetical protein